MIQTASLLTDLEFNNTKPAIKILLESAFSKEIRIAFSKGQFMKTHKTSFPITVEIFDGVINFGVNETTNWSICSSIGAFMFTVTIFNIKTKFKKVPIFSKLSRIIFEGFFIASYLIIIANLLNALNVIFHREFGPYFVALVLPNCVSGYMFIRLVLRPLRNAIRHQEAAKLHVAGTD